jgi:hypothetical protein
MDLLDSFCVYRVMAGRWPIDFMKLWEWMWLYHLDIKNTSMVFLQMKSATPACPAGRQAKLNQGDAAGFIIITNFNV